MFVIKGSKWRIQILNPEHLATQVYKITIFNFYFYLFMVGVIKYNKTGLALGKHTRQIALNDIFVTACIAVPAIATECS